MNPPYFCVTLGMCQKMAIGFPSTLQTRVPTHNSPRNLRSETQGLDFLRKVAMVPSVVRFQFGGFPTYFPAAVFNVQVRCGCQSSPFISPGTEKWRKTTTPFFSWRSKRGKTETTKLASERPFPRPKEEHLARTKSAISCSPIQWMGDTSDQTVWFTTTMATKPNK